jgi:hypothetical protein
MLFVSLLLLALGGISKSFMDLSSENNMPLKGYYWNKSESWKSKWKTHNGHMPVLAEKGDNWWYLRIINPRYKEKFPFSSTALVFATDFWHLSQGFFLKFVILGVYLFPPVVNPYIDIILVYVSMLIPFELTYSFFKNKPK